MLIKTWLLIAFLTLGMHGIYQSSTWTVTAVNHGMVTLQMDEKTYIIEEAEAWRVGDKANCIINKDGAVVTEFVHVWRKGR